MIILNFISDNTNFFWKQNNNLLNYFFTVIKF